MKFCTAPAYVLSTGAAYGNTYTTEEMLEAFHKQRKVVGDASYDVDFTNRVFRACGFDGHSVVLPKEDLFRTFSREEYLQHRQKHLVGLALRACEQALQEWGGDRKEITHLFWGTMTGALDSPTIDIHLAKALGLDLDISRTNIEGMGCLTGFRLLNMARSEAQRSPQSRMLVIEADLRSALGNSLPDKVQRADIVSAALFRDAASAAVVSGSWKRADEKPPLYELVHGASRIVPGGHHLVDYHECNGGAIRLLLSKDLPKAIGGAEPAFVKNMVADAIKLCKDRGSKMPPESNEHYDVLCHTGGPRVLKEITSHLGVTEQHLASSWAVMKSRGNLSGASNLSVLDHHIRNNFDSGMDWALGLSMGPGPCLEGVVFRRITPATMSAREAHSLKTAPLGDPTVDALVYDLIQQKIKEEHVSTMYDTDRGIKKPSWFFPPLKYIVPLFLLLMLTVDCCFWSDGRQTASTAALLAVSITSLAASIVTLFPVDEATMISLVGVSFMMLGAIMNMSASPTVVSPDYARLGTAIGFSFLALGVQIFCYSSFIFLAWQFMLGSALLSVGLFLRSWTSLLRVLHQEFDLQVASKVDIAAIPFFIVALALMGMRSFINMRRPWLCPPNFVFYGTVMFGLGEVVGGSILSISSIANAASDSAWLLMVNNLTRGAMFIATVLLLMDAAITRFHLQNTVEYSYPAMTMLVSGPWCIYLCNLVGGCLAFGSALGFVWHSSPDIANTDKDRLDATFAFVAALAFGFLALLSHCPSHKRLSFNHRYQFTGCVLLASAFSLRACATLVTDTAKFELQIASEAVGMCGALVLVSLALKLPTALGAHVVAFQAKTFIRLLHPGNYFLLASLMLGLAFLLWLLEAEVLGYLSLTLSGLTLLFHLSMTHHVHQIVQSPDLNKVCNTCPAKEAEVSISRSGTNVDHHVDVLICGGGPTGLLMASILGKNGLSVMLVEARPKPVEDARFTVINSASMEILAKALDPDIFAELRTRAMPNSTPFGTMLVTGLAHEDAEVLQTANSPSRQSLMQRLGEISDICESRILGSKHASELPIRANQSHQEAVLKKQVERCNSVQLLYGHRLIKMQVHGDSLVEAQICPCTSESRKDADHTKMFMVSSRYIIGADGPRSTVADGLGIEFDGFLNIHRTRSILVKAPGLYESVLKRLGGTFMYQVLRAKFGLCGIVAADPKKELWNFLMITGAKTKNATTDEICREFLGTSEYEAIADRHWFWNFFISRQWRKGPGFLAGDAAHSWPSFGATGGNGAYGDVANLAWKLVAVLKGHAGDALLDSYETERRQQAVQMALFVLSCTPRPQLLNRYIIPYAQNPLVLSWFKYLWYYGNSGKHIGNHFCQSGVQLGTKYNHSPVIVSEHSLPDDPFCDYHPCIRGGARLPFFHVVSPEDENLVVGCHDLVASNGYTLFVTSVDTPAKGEVVQALKEGFSSIDMPLCIHQMDVLTSAKLPGNIGTRNEAIDLWREELVILVRPDHVVAWHLPISSVQDDSEKDLSLTDVVATVTGYAVGEQQQARNYQEWLTKVFRFNLRPYGFIFPKAVAVRGETKENALGEMTKKNVNFDATTRNAPSTRTARMSGMNLESGDGSETDEEVACVGHCGKTKENALREMTQRNANFDATTRSAETEAVACAGHSPSDTVEVWV